MVLNKISFGSLLAGLLLKFGKVNQVDIDVIIKDLYSKHGIRMSRFALDYKEIINNVMLYNGTYYPIGDNVSEILESKQGDFIREYLNNVNIEDITLMKISEYGNVPKFKISSLFSENQEKSIETLLDNFFAIYVWNDDILYDNYLELQLTSLGKKRVFEIEYKEQIEEFKKLLYGFGYDCTLMDDFLKAQDFDKGVYEILNIENFLLYCSTYDRCATISLTNHPVLKKVSDITQL